LPDLPEPPLEAKKPIAEDPREAVCIYQQFRDYAKHEDGLINNRMTWIFNIHGFLYATYGFTIQKKLEVISAVATATLSKFNEFHHDARDLWQVGNLGIAILEIDIFLLGISVLGLFLSLFGRDSIKAAEMAEDQLRHLFHQKFSESMARAIESNRVLNSVCISKIHGIYFPDIAGGGVEGADVGGLQISRRMPTVMGWGWMFTILYSVFDIIVNYKYVWAAVGWH
jgi:hypothetical protein